MKIMANDKEMSWSWSLSSLSEGRISLSNDGEVTARPHHRQQIDEEDEVPDLQRRLQGSSIVVRSEQNENKRRKLKSKVVNSSFKLVTASPLAMKGDPNVGSSSSSAIKKRRRPSIKKRRRPSEVWNEMIKCKDGKAKCMHCGKLFDGSSKKGTTHLKNHLGRCPAKKRKGPGGRDGYDQDQSLSPSVKTKELASLIRKKSVVGLIKHFNTERDTSDEDFEHLSDTEGDPSDEEWEVRDDLDPGLLYSRKDEILQLYQEEKEKLCQFLNNLSCRFSLQLVWDPFGSVHVFFLVVYYIDDGWERQSKMISFWQDRPDERDLIEAVKGACLDRKIPDEGGLIEAVKQSCLDWKIDRNICSLLLPFETDLAEDRDNQIGKMESWFSQRGFLPFASFICDRNPLINYVRDKFKNYARDGVLPPIRQCVDYAHNKSTSDKPIQLGSAVEKAISMLKLDPCLNLFDYFDTALGLKEAFFELEQMDSDFMSVNLTEQKWDEATATFEHLKFLEAVTVSVLGGKCDIPIIVDLPYMHKSLTDRCNHTIEDCLFCKEVTNDVIDRFFSKYYLVRVIAVILDPRFRMDGVQLHYKEIYGSDADRYIEKVNKDFRDVYDAYAATDSSNSKSYEMLDARGRPCTSSSPKSELDLYIEELKIPAVTEFDILAWWRRNAPYYPTLARMAQDFLALEIPFADNAAEGAVVAVKDDINAVSEIFALCDIPEVLEPLVCLRGFLSSAEN